MLPAQEAAAVAAVPQMAHDVEALLLQDLESPYQVSRRRGGGGFNVNGRESPCLLMNVILSEPFCQ
jgi:hypothetical protein